MRRLGTAHGRALALLAWMLAGCTLAPSRPLPPPQPAGIVPAAQAWPRREVLDLALQAFRCGTREGRFPRPVLTVIDYSLPSTERRLWVIDLRRKRVLHHELVAHGDRSGDTMAVVFSNQIGSHQSSLGLFRTDETYTGSYGYSLRLTGLEPGVNDNARERAIVVHGASYVSRAAIAQWGRIGTTWGCPGLPEDVAPQIIDEIAGGAALFAYYPDEAWLRTSRYLHCGGPLADASDALAIDDTTPRPSGSRACALQPLTQTTPAATGPTDQPPPQPPSRLPGGTAGAASRPDAACEGGPVSVWRT